MSTRNSTGDAKKQELMAARSIIGHKFKEIRQSLGLKQVDFAASLGIRQGFLSEIERGIKAPSNALVTALLYRHKISPDWLYDISSTSPMFSDERGSSKPDQEASDSCRELTTYAEGSYDRFRAIFQKACQDLGVPELFQIVERASGTISDQFRRYNEGQIGDKDLYAILSRQIMEVLKFISKEFR